LSGDLVTKLKKEDAKHSRLVEIMERKRLFDQHDLKELTEFKIFPHFFA